MDPDPKWGQLSDEQRAPYNQRAERINLGQEPDIVTARQQRRKKIS